MANKKAIQSEPSQGPFAPTKFNLVEQEGWQRYDTANGKSMDWIHDAGWEDFRHMDLNTLEGLIDDISHVPQKGKKKSKLDFSSEELRYLAEQLKEGNDKLEEPKRLIVDAATWMYEAAAIPNDSDIESAIEKATEDLISYAEFQEDIWDEILTEKVRQGPMEWTPRKRYESAHILKQLSERIKLVHEKGKWDRFLVFDFWEAPIVHELFRKNRGSASAYEQLKREFQQLSDGYVADLFKYLDKEMENVDINNRTDWNASWKSMLGGGEPWGAQKELVEVLKEMPEEAEDA
jgi:hypothetical protein